MITFIVAAMALPSDSFNTSFRPRNASMHLANPMYSLNWIYASKFNLDPYENVWKFEGIADWKNALI